MDNWSPIRRYRMADSLVIAGVQKCKRFRQLEVCVPHEGLWNGYHILLMVIDHIVQISMRIIFVIQLDRSGLDESIVETEDAIMLG